MTMPPPDPDPHQWLGPVPDLVPRPDPTKLTLAALREAIERLEKQIADQITGLKTLHDSDLAALRELLEAKIDAAHDEHSRIEQLGYAEQRAIAQRFKLQEATRLEMKHDNTQAVSAALAAAKEFVLQQNAATKEQLVALAANWGTGHAALTSMVDDIKMRVAAVEAIRLGGKESQSTVYAFVGVALTVVWVAIALLALLHK